MQQVGDQGKQGQVSETKTSRSFARWVGFEEKTLWDWFQMLVVPVALAIGALYIDITASYIAADRQREESMNDYFSEMTTLLLEHNLRQADKASEVRSVARVRTLTTLTTLRFTLTVTPFFNVFLGRPGLPVSKSSWHISKIIISSSIQIR
jgi:hypothetical protein